MVHGSFDSCHSNIRIKIMCWWDFTDENYSRLVLLPLVAYFILFSLLISVLLKYFNMYYLSSSWCLVPVAAFMMDQ